jgi:hypothetical protein
MECRRPDEALERAARAAFDWDGGTRIGDSLDAFVRGWARRGLCRGGIVVVCSDGLDRGDPAVLAAAMERLSRLCHRLVWLNPHKGDDPHFRPSTLGMMIAAPHIDLLLSGHDQVVTREQVVDLADAVAPSDGIASGIGTNRYGARLVVEADRREEAIKKAIDEFRRAARKARLKPGPVVRTEAISEDEDADG